MRIAHLCLSSFYIDGYAYQENRLVAQHVADGHEVIVIASTESYDDKRRTVYLKPGRYQGMDGAEVVRLPYRKILPHALMRKVRMHPGVYRLLEEFAPDVILFHGTAGWELLTVARYKKVHPNTKFYVDSHTDAWNSALNPVSKYFLHLFLYRLILQRSESEIEKILCVNLDAIEFAKSMYGMEPAKLEFFPLGGRVFDDEEYSRRRRLGREALSVGVHQTLFVQSGKLDKRMMLLESMRAFTETRSAECRFIVVGYLYEDIAEEAMHLIEADPRIRYLGWKTPEELDDILCAADVYLKPRFQSATTQAALCCRCAVILHDALGHRPYVVGNGWKVDGEQQLKEAIARCAEAGPDEIHAMSVRSYELARGVLDYRVLAARICG